MVVFTAWLLKKGSTMRTLNDASIILLLLSMMGVMFLSAVLYLYYPGFTTLTLLLAFNMVTMSVFLIPALLTTFFGDRQLDDLRRGSAVRPRTLIIGSAIAFVFMSEVFMGWTFTIASGTLRAVGGSRAVYVAFVSSSSSYWFVFTMAAEMALTFIIMRRRFPDGMGWIVGAQPIMMFLSPTAIDNRGWVDFSFLASSAIMVAVFVYALHYLYKDRSLSASTWGYIVCLVLAYSMMMTGLLIWFVNGDALVFVLSVLFQMTVYFYVVLEEKQLGFHRPPRETPSSPMTVSGPA
jgi:hypothetical protein